MFNKLLPFALVLGLVAACQLAEPQPGYDVTSIALPQGDPHAGREAFVELGCTTCHQVAWERDLPDPVSGVPGPLLDGNVAAQTPGVLATAIIAPSHNISARLQMSLATKKSPMWDTCDAMKVRELIDLVAYLRSQGEITVADTVDTKPAFERERLPHHL